VLDFTACTSLPTVNSGPHRPYVIIAIPAKNEADRIAACLAALAMQRDKRGMPIPAGTFEVLIYVNNSNDRTAAVARETAAALPHPVRVIEGKLAPDRSNAGWARKMAMDLAADRLADSHPSTACILTTDADSCVSPTWIEATLAAFATGVDCVAGYVDAQPGEIIALGSAFLGRGRLEDHYGSQMTEIMALCDPISHDPWPNHRVSSGASLAVTLQAYRAIGGLTPVPVGEDAALTRRLEIAGLKVRHALDVCVTTSCRFDGRAEGGAADTMQYRHAVANAPCDDDLECAFAAAKRAIIKGRLRRIDPDALLETGWMRRLGLEGGLASTIWSSYRQNPFCEFWSALERLSPALIRGPALCPADLPREIRRADLIINALRNETPAARTGAPVGICDRARSFVRGLSA